MKPDLDAIRARCDAATRGPWNVVALTCPNGNAIVDSITGTGEPQWCDYGEGEGEWFTDSLVIAETDMGVYGPTMPDAQFIANARADVPALLAHIEELAERALTAEERLEQMTKERDALRSSLNRKVRHCDEITDERDKARADVEQKCAEVDMLRGVGCGADGDGPCGACRNCAYRRGSEAMRDAIRALLIPEEP